MGRNNSRKSNNLALISLRCNSPVSRISPYRHIPPNQLSQPKSHEEEDTKPLFPSSLDVLRFPTINLDNPVRLHHKVQILNLLRAELDHPPEAQAPLENLIFAVLCLTSNEIETTILNTQSPITSPFNPPLISLQWLDVYGKIIHIQEHTIALRDLVVRRGGLEAIELDGLAEVLSLYDFPFFSYLYPDCLEL